MSSCGCPWVDQNLPIKILWLLSPQRITAVEQSSFRIPVVICRRCFGHSSCQIMLKKSRGIAHNPCDIRASAAQTWMEREHFLMPSALVRSTACTDQAGLLEADPFELLALSCDLWRLWVMEHDRFGAVLRDIRSTLRLFDLLGSRVPFTGCRGEPRLSLFSISKSKGEWMLLQKQRTERYSDPWSWPRVR
jgi:hypothetical protein